MNRARIKLLAIGISVLGAIVYLGYAGVSAGWVYYMDVDHAVESRPAIGERVRVHGLVQVDEADIHRAQHTATFTLLGTTSHIRVELTGVIPDTFTAGREAVAEGTIDAQGVLHADTLLTKCASKYEIAKTPDAPARDGHSP